MTKVCLKCEDDFDTDINIKKFCSRSCQTTFNRETSSLCVIDGCGRNSRAQGKCATHRKQEVKGNWPSDIKAIIHKPNGKPTRQKNSYGYIKLFMPSHPSATQFGIVMEHRLVMEEYLGRQLLPGESVHHKNGVRDDNRIENLELWVTSQPAGQRPEDLVRWAKEILDRYDGVDI